MSLTVIERAMVVAYRNGMRDAITDYAIWKDGEQFVGALRRPLKDVITKVDEMPDDECLRLAMRAT